MITRSLAPYRAVLRVRAARRVLITGMVIRVPLWATAVALTLHVVSHLHRSYAESGTVAAVATLGLAVSAPWRGRLLDRVGVRRTLAPSLLVLALGWSVLPYLGYWPLLAGVGLVNAFEVPTFSIVRQALVHSVDETHRRTALALDSVLVEVSFMIGPAVGVLAVTYLPTPVALQLCAYATVLGGIALWLENPQLGSADGGEADGAHHRWLTPQTAAVLLVSGVATIVLTGSDIGAVAALRHMGHQPWIGWELAVWGLGSAVGGIVYGALARPVPLAGLSAALGLATLLVASGQGPLTLAALLFVSGFFCAPTITSTVDALTRLVPERRRGEALGWHGSAMTIGAALGSPLGGVAVDHFGWRGAFAAGAVGVLAGLAVAPVLRRGAAPSPPAAGQPDLLPAEAVATGLAPAFQAGNVERVAPDG